MKKKISQFQWKKVGILILIGGIFLLPQVFATGAEGGACGGDMADMVDFFYKLQYILSWAWVILGNFVGKLMTNTLIYGEFLGIDTFLWKVWQITRNIANFAIGFFFLYTLLKYLLFPLKEGNSPQTIIKDMLVAGVLVQMSWFLVMVLVDVSTITFATVSSFPSQVVESSMGLKNSLMRTISPAQENKTGLVQSQNILHYWDKGKIVKLHIGKNAPSGDNYKKIDETLTVEVIDATGSKLNTENMIDQLLPNADSLAGPLMYMGTSVFKTMNFVEKADYSGVNCADELLKHFVVYLLQRGMIALYTLALFVLVVVLVGRLLYLWIFIAISPLAFLLRFFPGVKDLLKGVDHLSLDFSKVITLIFRPVFFALYMSLAVLVLVTLSGIFQLGVKQDFNGALTIKTTENTSTMEVKDSLQVSLRNVALGFDNILLGAVALVLMWFLVKAAVTAETGIKVVDEFSKNAVSTAQKVIETTPMIPTPVGSVGIGNFVTFDGRIPLSEKFVDKRENRFLEKRESQIKTLFGDGSKVGLLDSQEKRLATLSKSSSTTSWNDFKKEIQAIRKERKIGFVDIKPWLYPLISGGMANYSQDATVKKELMGMKGKSIDDIHAFLVGPSKDHVFKSLYQEILGATAKHTLEIEEKAPAQYRLDIKDS